MELKMGFMSSREIAAWMEISYNTYKNNIKKKLEYLTNFATFEQVRGGVIIKEIFIPNYIKRISNDDSLYLEEIRACKDGLSSILGMVRKIKKEKEEFKNIKENSLRYRLTQAGNRTFGKTSDENAEGIYGTRHYVWAIKVDDFNKYRFMTLEEQQIYIEIRSKYIKNKEEEVERLALLKDAYNSKEISALEYIEKSFECVDFFGEVIVEFKARTGLQIVRATEHELFEKEGNWGAM